MALCLVPSDCTDPAEALLHLTERFSSRYGDTHPIFYIGSLASAVNEASGGSVAQVGALTLTSLCLCHVEKANVDIPAS